MNEEMRLQYDWLDAALLEVKTPKYFEVGPRTDLRDLLEFEAKHGILPEEYRWFILNYGQARLFRRIEAGWHWFRVEGIPEEVFEEKTHTFAVIARVEDTFVYVVKELGSDRFEDELLEHYSTGGIRKTGRTSSSWLKWRFERYRKTVKRAEWNEIVRGPAPFTPEEERIAEARGLYKVQKIGADGKNNVILEVYNGSKLTLQYLTVFLKGTIPQDLTARSPVYVGDVPPGGTKTFPINFYKDRVDAESVAVQEGFRPGPEDRYVFFELIGPDFFRKALADGRKLASQKTDLPPPPDAPINRKR